MTPVGKGSLLIFGAGGHGRVVADAAQACGHWDDIAFLDDRFPDMQESGPWRVIGRFADAAGLRARFGDAAFGVGHNPTRLAALETARTLGYQLPAIVHPSAVVSRHASVAAGGVVLACAVINLGAVLDDACIVNTGAIVEHDCRLGPGVHVSPGAVVAGAVHVGRCSWIGMNASVKQCLSIGSNVVVGAGAVVLADLPDGVTAVGVPARPLPPRPLDSNS